MRIQYQCGKDSARSVAIQLQRCRGATTNLLVAQKKYTNQSFLPQISIVYIIMLALDKLVQRQ